jgi:hypothetical protein
MKEKVGDMKEKAGDTKEKVKVPTDDEEIDKSDCLR